jgi:predicted lactoylglutathione lyase
MAKQFWLNLPVKDVKKSTDFFAKLGFKFNTQQSTPHSSCMLVGEKDIVVMLFDESTFQGFTRNGIANTGQGTEVLLSIDAQSKEEVDEIVQKAIEAGGTSTHKPSEMTGWMYGCVFADLDGHRWNILHMDMSKMPK